MTNFCINTFLKAVTVKLLGILSGLHLIHPKMIVKYKSKSLETIYDRFDHHYMKHDFQPVALAAVRSKVVVLLLFIVTPIVGVCNCSVLLYVNLCPF